MKYKKGDIVLVKSPAGDAIPLVHVKLINRIEVKPSKGRTMDWPGYVGWDAILTKEEEANILRKKFQIPYKFPDDIETFVFEENIVKKVRKTNRKRRYVRKNSKK